MFRTESMWTAPEPTPPPPPSRALKEKEIQGGWVCLDFLWCAHLWILLVSGYRDYMLLDPGAVRSDIINPSAQLRGFARSCQGDLRHVTTSPPSPVNINMGPEYLLRNTPRPQRMRPELLPSTLALNPHTSQLSTPRAQHWENFLRRLKSLGAI